MDEDEEEEDAEEGEEIDEEEENDVFNKDLGRKQFGDTKHYCPVMLKETGTQRVKINLRYNNFYLYNTVPYLIHHPKGQSTQYDWSYTIVIQAYENYC